MRFLAAIAIMATLVVLITPSTTKAAGSTSITRQYSPSANAASTDGDDNGFQTNPTNAYVDGGGYAADTDSGDRRNADTGTGSDKHIFYNFGISIPAGSTASGINVKADMAVDSLTSSPFAAYKALLQWWH